jgi:hypothetical protein
VNVGCHRGPQSHRRHCGTDEGFGSGLPTARPVKIRRLPSDSEGFETSSVRVTVSQLVAVGRAQGGAILSGERESGLRDRGEPHGQGWPKREASAGCGRGSCRGWKRDCSDRPGPSVSCPYNLRSRPGLDAYTLQLHPYLTAACSFGVVTGLSLFLPFTNFSPPPFGTTSPCFPIPFLDSSA